MKRFERFRQVLPDFLGFHKNSKDFMDFNRISGILQFLEGFCGFLKFWKDFRICFWISEQGVRDFRS